MPTDSAMFGSLPEMRTWPILLIKSDLKWCIHLSRFTLTLRTVLVQYIEFFVVVCNFDDFVDCLVYLSGINTEIIK